jgi:hypothetical protein
VLIFDISEKCENAFDNESTDSRWISTQNSLHN